MAIWPKSRKRLPKKTQWFILRATVRHINGAGALVKIEIATRSGDSVRVELTQERFRALALERDQDVFVSLKEARVFAEDYSI